MVGGIRVGIVVVTTVVAVSMATEQVGPITAAPRSEVADIPVFEYDPTWPKPLPNNWMTGPIGAMAVDKRDHIWVLQRPGGTTNLSERYGLEGIGECCFPAPPVMEFDIAGNLIQAWGPIHSEKGELLGKQTWGPFPDIEWPLSEHGIYIDHKDNVWIDNNGEPSQVLKFTRDGKFLMRIGMREAKSINDPANFAGPTGIVISPQTNELFIADGYRNRRVIVLDAETGAYKRHWGAYGKPTPDGPQGLRPVEGPWIDESRRTREDFKPGAPPSQQFATVHCLMQSRDSLLYVCDRVNNRIQVFQPDGTFVRELVVAQSGGFGAVHAIGFSPDAAQRFLYVGDGANKKIWIIRRSDLTVLGSFGRGGRGGGQFLVIHALAVDSKGNLYVGETINNNRVQKFAYKGLRRAS